MLKPTNLAKKTRRKKKSLYSVSIKTKQRNPQNPKPLSRQHGDIFEIKLSKISLLSPPPDIEAVTEK